MLQMMLSLGKSSVPEFTSDLLCNELEKGQIMSLEAFITLTKSAGLRPWNCADALVQP